MNDSKNNQLVKTSIHSDCILRVTLNNPSQHNVLSEEMMSAIQSVLASNPNNSAIDSFFEDYFNNLAYWYSTSKSNPGVIATPASSRTLLQKLKLSLLNLDIST